MCSFGSRYSSVQWSVCVRFIYDDSGKYNIVLTYCTGMTLATTGDS